MDGFQYLPGPSDLLVLIAYQITRDRFSFFSFSTYGV